MRAQIAFPVIDFPSAWASGPDEYLHKGRELIEQWKDHELVQIAIGPHAPYTVSDESLRQVAALSEESGAPIQIHLHETAFEVEESLKTLGRRPLDRLADLGCLTALTQCVHMTQVADSDIDKLLSSHAAVIHSPESNLKLASGFCPVQKLLDAGVRLGLGTDGAASNNDLDMFGEMHTAALIGKAVAGRADAVTASAALHMATLGGADALGLGSVCGSIESGKSADLTAVKLDGLSSMPVYDLVSHLVYSVNSRDVSDVWVAGRRQLSGGSLTHIDVDELGSRVRRWQAVIASSADSTNLAL
jgi:5-methylthioadenosine/S-adenosylhomocysteine deaminase